jgi:DNA-directed RNA polymerase specialized sigma24 family protein
MATSFLILRGIMVRHRPTVVERAGRPLASARSMAEGRRDELMTMHCGRCVKLLMMRPEDIKEKRTIDCETCEKPLPPGNALLVTRASRGFASAHAGTAAGIESLGANTLVDAGGNPLSTRLQRVLGAIPPRFRHRFPELGDELLVTEVLEEAGRRIADREQASGPVDNLDAYAWVTVLNVARSRMRHPSMRLVRSTLGSEESHAVFGTLQSTHGAPEHIEAAILVQEVLAQLTADERWLCSRKQLGLSSREIAREQGTSVARVNTLFYRVKRKIRNALCGARAGAGLSRAGQPTNTRTA